MDPIFSRNLDPNSDRNWVHVSGRNWDPNSAGNWSQILPEIGVQIQAEIVFKAWGKMGPSCDGFLAAGRWRDGVFPRYKTTVTGPAGLCFSVAKILIYLGPNSVRNWTQILAESGVQILTEIGTQFWQKM